MGVENPKGPQESQGPQGQQKSQEHGEGTSNPESLGYSPEGSQNLAAPSRPEHGEVQGLPVLSPEQMVAHFDRLFGNAADARKNKHRARLYKLLIPDSKFMAVRRQVEDRHLQPVITWLLNERSSTFAATPVDKKRSDATYFADLMYDSMIFPKYLDEMKNGDKKSQDAAGKMTGEIEEAANIMSQLDEATVKWATQVLKGAATEEVIKSAAYAAVDTVRTVQEAKGLLRILDKEKAPQERIFNRIFQGMLGRTSLPIFEETLRANVARMSLSPSSGV